MYVLGVDIGKTTGIAFVDEAVRDTDRRFYNTIMPVYHMAYPWINEKYGLNFASFIEDGMQKCHLTAGVPYSDPRGVRYPIKLIIAEMPAIHFGYRHQAIYSAAQRELEKVSEEYGIMLRYITPGIWKNSWIKKIKLKRELGIHVRDATQIALWAIFNPKLKGSTKSAAEIDRSSLVVLNRSKENEA